jgi:lipoprotein-anchoring transpeptidase ErfK/SrfK
VTSSEPIGPAAWAWSDPRTAIFRPKEFWPGHATVTVSAAPTYAVLGRADDRDIRWAGGASSTFSTGPARVITVDAQTDQATVVADGVTVRTMPVSLGMDGWETRSGTKVLMEKYEVKHMTSESIGAEDEYELDVPYAIRLTNSGEFIHAAPWATDRLGRWNGSHGCTNVSMADAKWLYHNHLYGDPVITTGTSRSMDPSNGAGGVWNVPWKTWKAGRATVG